jgi:hypothetical protein
MAWPVPTSRNATTPSLGGAENLLEVPGKEARVVRLLLCEQVTDLGQDDR